MALTASSRSCLKCPPRLFLRSPLVSSSFSSPDTRSPFLLRHLCLPFSSSFHSFLLSSPIKPVFLHPFASLTRAHSPSWWALHCDGHILCSCLLTRTHVLMFRSRFRARKWPLTGRPVNHEHLNFFPPFQTPAFMDAGY